MRFDLGLEDRSGVVLLVSTAASVTGALVGLAASRFGVIAAVLSCVVVLVGLRYLVRRFFGTVVVVGETGLVILRKGPLGTRVEIAYGDILQIESLLKSTRLAIRTVRGETIVVGPLQDLERFLSKKKIDAVAQLGSEKSFRYQPRA